MSFLKNITIKAVTKKRTRQFTTLIESALNTEEFQQGDMNSRVICILSSLIETIENQDPTGNFSFNIDTNKIKNWKELLGCLVVQTVRGELAYDPSIGEEKDLLLIEKVFNREIEAWKKKLKTMMKEIEKSLFTQQSC
jgi:hypothetical protein